jgi:hypothetical protein
MFRHSGDMARGTSRSDHGGVAQGGAAFQIDGDDILRLVVLQRGQDALEQIALRRGFLGGGWFAGNGFLGGGFFDGLLDGLRGFRRPFGGFGSRFFAGGRFGSFTSQGGDPFVSGG